MNLPETLVIDGERVACDGGGASGHPRVFLHVGAAGAVDCPYCGRRFLSRAAARASAAATAPASTDNPAIARKAPAGETS